MQWERREFIGAASGVAGTLLGPQAGAQAAKRLKPRASKEIAGSKISIGYETLDRQQYDPARTYEHAGALGVKWARCQTGWARTETKPGEFDFAWLDEIVDSLLERGIQPWFNLGYGNRVYSASAPHESAVGWAPVFTPQQTEAWQRFVDRIGGHFASRVKHWEIWNEPNIAAFWQPEKPSPAGYVKLAATTAPILRKRVRDVTLIGGAYAGIPGSYPYAEEAMEAGLGNYVDKISYHPYRPRPEWNYRTDIAALRGMLERYGKPKPLWQGENGAPSFGGGEGAMSNLQWTEATQARWLLRRLMMDLALDVELTSYFLIVDIVNYVRREGQTGKTNPKGVLRGNDYTPKPSYFALQNLCALFDNDTRQTDLLLRTLAARRISPDTGIETATFLRKGAPVYVWWSPSDLQKPFTPGTADFEVWSGKAATLRSPILVDLLNGTVTPLELGQEGSFLRLRNVPVADYPIVLTDAAVVATA